MQFSISRDVLVNALHQAQSVVEKRNTVPILANILCSVSGSELSLAATDLEVGIKVTLPVEKSTDGKITISAKHFAEIVKELPTGQIEVRKKDNNWVEIVSGKIRFNIVSSSADEYPALPAFQDKHYYDARSEALRDMIDQTSFSVATDATRYHLNGVYLEQIENNVMRMTGTDGHRLSFVDSEIFSDMPELKRGIIIPRKGLLELKKVLDGANGTVGLSFERGNLFARFDNTFLFVRLIDGEYPDYRQVIPKSTERLAVIPRDAFSSALKRVSLLAHEKSRGVKLSLAAGTLTVLSSNPDMGDARDEMDVDYSSEPVEIGYNAKYLLDCLSVMRSDEVEFHFKDRFSPGILRGRGQPNHTYVIMPMRI
jgi:DNA polymerase-3 subunit beta